MADMMTFPDTVEEFMEEYKLVDTEQVYTNGTELVPIFRMKQWFEHEKAQLSKEGTTKDTISRQQAIDALDVGAEFLRRVLDVTDLVGVERTKYEWGIGLIEACIGDIKEFPPAQPEPKEGHWILHETSDGGEQYECSECGVLWEFNDGTPEDNEAFYCPKCGVKMKGEQNGH